MSIAFTMIVMFTLGFLAALLVDSESERKWKEKQRRIDIRRQFEREMRKLRERGIDC